MIYYSTALTALARVNAAWNQEMLWPQFPEELWTSVERLSIVEAAEVIAITEAIAMSCTQIYKGDNLGRYIQNAT